jgi:pyruvate dehydrogenase E2 component (dihydrolipoamide acetyltransferase)
MAQVFELPDLGEGIHEAEIFEVLVSVGDSVEEGQPIFIVETDKASVEIPSPYSGSVEEIRVESGDIVRVGDPLISFDGNGAKSEGVQDEEEAPLEEVEKESETEAEAEEEQPEAEEAATGPKEGRPVPASPATRRLARELDVNLRQVPPSGLEGQVTAQDVRAFAEEKPEKTKEAEAGAPSEDKPAPPAKERPPLHAAEALELPDFNRWGSTSRTRLRSVRRTTAQHMAQAWNQIPHINHTDEANITELDQLRKQYKDEIKAGTLTLTVFVMKAVVAALKEYPRFNASLDVEAQEIILKDYYHLGVAVDTDRGLIVPVIRDVDRKSITQLAQELADLVQRTRDGETSLEDVQGGTFTITNVGILGGTNFSPIINFPQVAILGMAEARWKPTVQNVDGRREIEPRFMLPLIGAADHRVLDGADLARFISLMVDILEDPDKLMLML